MPAKREISQEKTMVIPPIDHSSNGNGAHTIDAASLPELVAPEHDLPDDGLEEALRNPPQPPAPSDEGGDEGDEPFNLDEALGDENALRHELLDTAPPPIAVRAPRKREFITVHPRYQRVATILEYSADGMSRDYYIATPHIKARLETEDKKTALLRLCQSLKDRTWFVWPLILDQDGRENAWNRSSLAFADEAARYWGRRVNAKTQYVYRKAEAGHEPPTWPDKPWQDILAEAFKDRLLASPNHPVILDLEGRR
jgi:hypothetical protein